MRCFDESVKLESSGESSEEFEQVIVQFSYCDDTISVCLPSAAAETAMRGKSVLVLSNESSSNVNVAEIAGAAFEIRERSKVSWAFFNT